MSLSSRTAQAAIAAAFLSFAAVALATPDTLATLGGRGSAHEGGAIAPLAIGALGAHAAAAGLFAAFMRFKSYTFMGFAVALTPVFAADWWLYAKAGAFNSAILLHAGGMAAVVALCALGFAAAQRAEQTF